MGILDSFYANPMQFANEAGLYALLSIIPLIIIYLLRPRPRKIKIPSLMFLLDIERKKRLNIFRKFLKDPLFWIQLLVLILVSLAVAAPYIIANEEAGGGHTVIILDASASMQADGKFNRAVQEANKFLGPKNTLILAENVPVMVMKESPSGSAAEALKKLKAKGTASDMASAILSGSRLLPDGGRMIVLSDFSSYSGDDPGVTKALAESKGIKVEFVPVKGKTDNIGIVNGWFESNGDYKITIKNFNTDPQTVNIDVTTDDKNVLTQPLTLKAGSSEYFAISNLNPGITKISINSNDALPVDNNAFIVMPRSLERNLLYVSDVAKTPSSVALSLIPSAKVDKRDTNNIPGLSDYSVVFVGSPLSDASANSLSDYVNAGGNAVIIASPDLKDMDLLPVQIGSVSGKTSLNVLQPTRITEGIGIDKVDVKKHINATAKSGAVVLVEGGDGSAMLAFWRSGRGMVIYSGFADPQGGNIYDPLNENVWNDFHAHPEYPLFWQRTLEWLKGSLDVSEYNVRTGAQMKLAKTMTVKTPGESVNTNVLLLDEVGVYELPDRFVAANLYDEKESNLAGSYIVESSTGTGETGSSTQTIRSPKYLDIYLIMIAMFLVFLELYYLRWRGEL